MLGVCSLFVPSSAPRMINAGLSFNASSIIFDLEDAVSIEEKDSARDLMRFALPLYKDHAVAVRINDWESCWREDVELLRYSAVDTLILPKVDANFVAQASAVLDTFDSKSHIAVLIETAHSLEHLTQIVTASSRVTSLLLGAEDYCLDMGVQRTREGIEILYARNRLSNVARTYKLEALDTPFADTSDEAGLEEDCLFAKNLGFTGKLCINPNQIDVIQKSFLPSQSEIAWAKLVVAEAKKNKSKGAFSVQGKMVDKPIIRRAEKILENSKQGELI